MEVLAKNMIITSSAPLLNYGRLDKGPYILLGQVQSASPFTLTILADGVVVNFKSIIYERDTYLLYFDDGYNYEITVPVEKFELQFDTTEEKKINLKLWKNYPITEPEPVVEPATEPVVEPVTEPTSV